MPTELPYAADAEEALSYDELEVLRLQYQKELSQSHVTVQTKFNYAWGLVKSPLREHQVEGVGILQDIYRQEPGRRRECLYYLALGNYKLGNYEQARQFNDILLEKEPTNLQAQSLATLIDKRVTRDGYVGMAIVGGVAALSTLVLASIIRKGSQSSSPSSKMTSCYAATLFFLHLYITTLFVGLSGSQGTVCLTFLTATRWS